MPTALNHVPVAPSEPTHRPATHFVDAVHDALIELKIVLEAVSPTQYAAPGTAQHMGASVGGHVRHCLDHVAAIVAGLASGVIDYESRLRGTPVETDPARARDEIDSLQAAIAALDPDIVPGRVDVLLCARRGAAPLRVPSTFAREFAFALSHSIHHNAMIRGLLVAHGVAVPSTFGYAPSTPTGPGAQVCARSA